MKKHLLLAAAVLICFSGRAQSDSLKWVKEINEQVWKPFIVHLTSGNNEGFSKLHSKRITRVTIDDGTILDYEKYFPPQSNNSNTQQKTTSLLFELRFDKRISNGTKAWETGYYKGRVMKGGVEQRSYYGRFFVVLEKEEGDWKIIVDADTGAGATVENFNKASSLE
jgi:hypothetical protein